jgi:hypothetical protein
MAAGPSIVGKDIARRGPTRRQLGLMGLAAALGAGTAAVYRAASRPSLVPRSALFDAPGQVSVQLSPDGRRLAWRWTFGLLVAPVDGLAAGSVLNVGTFDGGYFWAYDNRTIIVSNDADGDENFRLLAVDSTKQGSARYLTPQAGVRRTFWD